MNCVINKYRNGINTTVAKRMLLPFFMACFVTLQAQNINTPNKMGPLGTQVNTFTGNLFIPRNDLDIPARGFDLNITFFYNSFNFDQNKGFGNGWGFIYNVKCIDDTGTNKIIQWGDGREDYYTAQAGGGYQAPNGFFDTLSQYQAGKYLLTELDGTKYYFDNNIHKKITRMEERNGNFINFNYADSLLTSMINNEGQSISFTYNPSGLLTSVVDAVATPLRTWYYTYDGSKNLQQVTDPLGGTSKYTYLVNGPMKTLSDKNNNTIDIIYYPDFTTSEIIGCNKRQSFSYDTTSKTTVATDYLPTGTNQETIYKYQEFDHLAWITSLTSNCCGYNMTFEFDAHGNKTKQTDANGNITSYTYDSHGNMLKMTDALNQTMTYSYSSAFNNIISFTDAKGFTTALTYNGHGNLIQLTDPGNLTYSANYNSNGDIISSTDPKGNTFNYNYDAFGNPTDVSGPNGYHGSLGFDARGNLLSYTDALSNTSGLEYDILNRLKKITDPINNNIQLTYDAEGNATSVKNQNNETSHFGYDASNRLVQVTDVMNNKSSFGYDAMDNPLTITNALGNAINYTYDNRNRLSSIKDAEGNTGNISYDPNGNIIALNLPNGEQLSYTYDALNRITIARDNSGAITNLGYDKNDNVISYTNGVGATTTAEYDNLNRVKKLTDPLGNSYSLTYDNNSNISTVTDRNGFVKNYTYDNLNRISTYTDHNGFVIALNYDAEGNVVSLKDQNNNITTYTYDNLNRVKTTTYPDARFIQFTYDSKGNIVTKRQTDGNNINFTYDSLNRIIAKTLPDGQIFTYGYDALSRVIAATNNTGTVNFAYDDLNRLISETFGGRTVQYSYSITGRTQTTIYPDSTTITKTFDTRNRLTGISEGNNNLASYQYNNVNQVIKKSFANGVTTNLQYDFANRLSNFTTGNNGAIQNTSFTYDKEGNKLTINRLNNPSLSEQFTYDNGYRITDYKRGPIGGTAVIHNLYIFDAVGNRISANLNGTNTSYTVNNLNQLTNSNNGTQNINFIYDNNGNLTYDGVFYKTYDAEERLVKDSSSIANVLTYQYDAFGRRVQTTYNGFPLKYTYAGLSPIEERDGITGDLRTRTIFRNFLTPVKNENNNNNFFYHQNELNSVEAITSSNGSLTERYQYDLYGKQTIYDASNHILPTSLAGNRFGFTGQEYDSANGTNHFYFRNYNPSTGTFNQRDLIGYADGMGMYQYVGNDPANGIDIFGLDCEENVTEKTEGNKEESWKEKISEGWEKIEFYWELTHHGSHITHEIIDSKMEKIIEQFDKLGELEIALDDLGELGDLKSVLTDMQALGKTGDLVNGIKNVLGPLAKGLNVLNLGISAVQAGSTFANSKSTMDDRAEATANTGLAALNFNPAGAGLNIGYFVLSYIPGSGSSHSFYKDAEYAQEFWGLTGAEESLYSSHWYGGDAESDATIYQYLHKRGAKWKEAIKRRDQKIEFYSTHLRPIPNCPQNGPTGGTRKPPHTFAEFLQWLIEIIQSGDPNFIIGPDGQPSLKWVSVNDRMPYTILYENSKAASAPAKFVRITSPIEPKQDPSTFQLGTFGFNNQTFTVPNNTASYYQRLDCRDSLGLYVDITAGYDQINNQAFWQFQSVDPLTLLPPTNPLKGFLLLQDSAQSLNGHAFVNFSIKPVASAATLDTIGARASIVFDGNDTIPTNIATNTIDAVAPTSHMNAIAANSINPVTLSWTGVDDAGGSGIDYYSIYVTTDNINYSVLIPRISRTDTTITLPSDSSYCFFVLATDRVGNKETLRPGEIKCSYLGAPLPITWLYFRGKTVVNDNVLDWSTANEQNSKEYDVERSFDGSSFNRIGIVKAVENSTQTNTYQYIDPNIDRLASNVMFYRLKQIDVDGKFTYSNVVRLTYKATGDNKTIVYPNPTEGSVTVFVTDAALIGTQAVLYDINGRVLQRFEIASNSQLVNLSRYVNGTYFIKLINSEVLKVIKQ